jgi:hypothetical protein
MLYHKENVRAGRRHDIPKPQHNVVQSPIVSLLPLVQKEVLLMSYTDQSFTSGRARLALLLRRRVGSQREDKDFDTMIRIKCFQIFAFSIAGVAMMVIEGIASWFLYSSGNNTDAYYDDPLVPVRLSNALYIGQAFISSSTFVTIVLIAQRYQLELIRKRAEWSGTNIFEVEGFRGVAVRDTTQRDFFLASFNFWRSRLAVSFGLEVLVHIMHPVLWMASVSAVPTTPATYSYTSINLTYKLFQLAMFLRLYLVHDLIHVTHPAYKNRFEIVNNDPDLLSVGFEIDSSLTLKMIVHQWPTLAFIAVSLVALVVFGYAVFNLERVEGEINPDSQVQFIKPENAFWFAFVTSRTIGFGEFSPRTVLGRVAAALCVLAGIATASIYSGVLVAQIPLSKELKQAVEFLHTSQADSNLRTAAAELIQTAWRRKLVRRLREQRENTNVADVRGGLQEGDIIMDRATAKEQAAATANLSRFGLDINNQGHKADRLYYGIKQFRDARKQVQGAFTQANDVVVNQKMDSLMSLSQALKRELLTHQTDFEATEKEIIDQFTIISQQVLYYRKLGHVPI